MDNLRLSELKQVRISGVLRIDNRSYWLITPTPEPIEGDFETKYDLLRFVAVPTKPIFSTKNPSTNKVIYYYEPARHLIVPPNFTVEYKDRNPIFVYDKDKVQNRLAKENINNA